MRQLLKVPETVRPQNIKLYTITQIAYLFGATGHLSLGFFFLWLKVYPMVYFNFILSVPIFTSALYLNRRGRHSLAFSLALFELFFHQVGGVYFLGWESGFQYFLIYLAGLVFFNANWNNRIRFFLILVVAFSFFILYLFCGNGGIYQAPDFIYHLLYLTNSLATLFLMAMLINSYVRTADRAEGDLRSANQKLLQKNKEIENTLKQRDQAYKQLDQERQKSDELAALLKKMFGRYLSAEVMNSLIEDPSSLELGGEKRNVTLMMTDLRGFTALCERMKPEEVVQMLNGYFDVMMQVIDNYNGTVNEIIGDALLVIFGAPQEMPDRNERAVACAIHMQNAMMTVNQKNRSKGLPELEMGIGLNETEVIVGNVGSSKRSKYAVVGSGVNLTSRIESYTVGGQILVSESLYEGLGDKLRIDSQRDVFPKGSETPLRIYEVGGISGDYHTVLEAHEPEQSNLSTPIPIRYHFLEGKDTEGKEFEGFIHWLSKTGAGLSLTQGIEPLANIKMNLRDVNEKLANRHFYAKAIQASNKDSGLSPVRFTAVPPEIDAYFEAFRKFADERG